MQTAGGSMFTSPPPQWNANNFANSPWTAKKMWNDIFKKLPYWNDFIDINMLQIPWEIESALWKWEWAAACNWDQRAECQECPQCLKTEQKTQHNTKKHQSMGLGGFGSLIYFITSFFSWWVGKCTGPLKPVKGDGKGGWWGLERTCEALCSMRIDISLLYDQWWE